MTISNAQDFLCGDIIYTVNTPLYWTCTPSSALRLAASSKSPAAFSGTLFPLFLTWILLRLCAYIPSSYANSHDKRKKRPAKKGRAHNNIISAGHSRPLQQ